MSKASRPKLTNMTVCDLCDEEIPDDGYAPGESGSLTHGFIDHKVHTPFTKLARLIWPPAGRDRLMGWKERQKPENQYRVYEFHAQCIRDLVEKAIAERAG